MTTKTTTTTKTTNKQTKNREKIRGKGKMGTSFFGLSTVLCRMLVALSAVPPDQKDGNVYKEAIVGQPYIYNSYERKSLFHSERVRMW